MQNFMDRLEGFLSPIAVKLNQNRYLSAVKDGFFVAMPFIILGSIFLLLSNLPIPGYPDFMEGLLGAEWTFYFTVPFDMSMNILALYVLIGASNSLAGYYKVNKIGGVTAAVAGVLLLTPTIENADGAQGIPTVALGAEGLFLIILSVILAIEIYRFVIQRGWVIKMPESVPANVSTSFSSLIPVFFVIIIFTLIRILFGFTPYETAQNFIYSILQAPLTALGATLPAYLFGQLFETVLWAFGIHGSVLHSSIMEPVWLTLSAENLTAYREGNPAPNIISYQFHNNFVKLGGAGSTLGLVILSSFMAKSEQFKSIGRLALGPSFFNINEPVVFGIPIVLNPMMLIPFILTPLVLAVITYVAMATGLVSPGNGIVVPWTTPPFFSGFLISGVGGVLLQLVNAVVTAVIYFPFFRIEDQNAYDLEQGKDVPNI